MAITTETRETTKDVAVYRCDRCGDVLGEGFLGEGFSVVTSLAPRDGRPSTPDYANDWHWELCRSCFAVIVESTGKGIAP